MPRRIAQNKCMTGVQVNVKKCHAKMCRDKVVW